MTIKKSFSKGKEEGRDLSQSRADNSYTCITMIHKISWKSWKVVVLRVVRPQQLAPYWLLLIQKDASPHGRISYH